MKIKILSTAIAALLIATVFFAGCTKDNNKVTLEPQLATAQVLQVKSDSATVVGFIIAAGDGFTEKGICYNTEAAPTIANSKTIYTGAANTATFNVKLGGLTYATKYYARAYATNASGTIYGDEYSFTTLPVKPTVTTAVITEITGKTATGGGNVTITGGADVTKRGVCFGKVAHPTVADFTTSDGTGAGAFVSSLKDLQGLTKYFVRAYATNSVGTSYGNEVEFTTLVSIRNWNVPGNYVAASYPGSILKDWDPANSPQVQSLEATPDKLEGFIYMAGSANEWKFASQPNWNGPNYGADAVAGKLSTDPNAGNFTSPAGYYKINADAAALTYTAVATVWGVIGDATPNAWNDETPALTYSPALRTWNGGVHLTVGEFKFRANHSWDYNYGSTTKDANLTAGGDNIKLTVAGDYAITLDLSHPNAYTYSANTWGIIGAAVPVTGWDSDHKLTWDATNKVFTITLALTAGEYKFRANTAWDLALGGTLDALSTTGANLSVAAAGTYKITLDPWALKATAALSKK